MQKHITVLILDPTAGEAARLGAELESATPADIEIRSQGFDAMADMKDAMKQSSADCLLLHLCEGGDSHQDLLNRFARQSGGPATVVLANDTPLEQELEWVHRGVQDIVRRDTPAGELLRVIMMAQERKHLLNDAHEALRLEQENVLKMQNFVDELVGFATRTATHGS